MNTVVSTSDAPHGGPCAIPNIEIVDAPLPNKSTFFKICWWNGGGNIKLRLNSNPELRKFLSLKPDLFVYGESCTPSTQGLSINGYACYLHKAKLNVAGNYRRGLAIFYLEKYCFLLTKVYSSKRYDIVWIRLNFPKRPMFFCFFYSPGSHHPLDVRHKFYDLFSAQYTRFASLGRVYLLGDTNARLGHLLGDKNVHGEFITNSNQPLFLNFLQYSGLAILNSVFCKGVPTYEIVNKKRSIIDLGLTNSIASVLNFQVEPTPFGVNSQTCHRALTITISVLTPQRPPTTAPRRPRRLMLDAIGCRSLGNTVSNRLLACVAASADYSLLVSIFKQSKKKIVVRRPATSSLSTSPALRLLQRRYSEAIASMQKEKTEFSYFVVDNLEKLLKTQYEREEEVRVTKWLQKMNNLDFGNRTRVFFSELRKRHNVSQQPCPIVDCSGKLSNSLDQTLGNWAEYYKKLYFCNDPLQRFPTPDDDPILDGDLEYSEFLDAYYTLNTHKSPGYHGLTGEDFLSLIPLESPDSEKETRAKLASLKFIFRILENFWFNESAPRDFKRTILCPFLKDDDKDHSDPGNYRPISLLNSLMKIYEGIICKRLVTFFEARSTFSHYQAAYRKNRSIFDHVLVIHDLFLEYRFFKTGPRGGKVKRPLYFCFLDFKKAFDTVDRNILFRKLYNAGARGKILRVVINLFSKNAANVSLNGFLSPEFTINRGVLQGSKLGPILFNLFVNDLLNDLDRSKLGASIGLIHIAALVFADDIVLISDKPWKLQQLLNICHSWATKNKMAFNKPKCKVMIFNGGDKQHIFTLGNTELTIVTTYRYLGVLLTSSYVTNLFKAHFQDILQRAKTRAAAMRCHVSGTSGFRIKSSIKMYKLQVRPILEFCAQSLAYSLYSRPAQPNVVGCFAQKLEHLQTQILKSLINCPRATSPAIARLFCGSAPLVCRLEILKLRYFWKVLHGPSDTLASSILKHRRNRPLDFNIGFTRDVFNICVKYDLMHIWDGLAPQNSRNPNLGLNPLHYIKRTITSHNLRKDLECGRKRNCSFAHIYLLNPFTYQTKYHIVEPFSQANCFSSPQARKHFTRALLHPCSYLASCPLCGEQTRDSCDHLLTACPRIPDPRKKLHLKLSLYNFPATHFPLTKLSLIELSLSNRLWRKCFAEFLNDVDF